MRGVRRRAFGVAGAVAVLLAATCGTLASRPFPLYPKVGDGPGPDKVALLYGPAQIVDDQNVGGKGQTFELLPGCHIVTLQRNVGEGTAGGAVTANVGHVVIAFRMRAAHRYVITFELEESTGPVGYYTLVAREKAADGTAVRLPFAHSDEDILSCKRWAQEQGL